ncbi:MAG TPA: BON domain-containing protein [Actinoplanes sp.]|nr:BON domain-containing protein [Actinoplanes sp.]
MAPQPFDDAWQDRRPRPASSPDIRLTVDVTERILGDPRLESELILVEVQNRVANLIGTVGSLHARITAAEIARSTPGVTDICNRLELARTADVTGAMAAPDPFDELVAHWSDEPRRPATAPRRALLLKGAAVVIGTVAVLLGLVLHPHLGAAGALLLAVPWVAVATALAVQSAL